MTISAIGSGAGRSFSSAAIRASRSRFLASSSGVQDLVDLVAGDVDRFEDLRREQLLAGRPLGFGLRGRLVDGVRRSCS